MTLNCTDAPGRPWGRQELSADNAYPARHVIIDLLRKAAPLLDLRPPVLATLDAMLSCLPPKRTHHVVHASNATLSLRRNGVSDRTLRRHAHALEELGLLVRNDSANGKRYTRYNPGDDRTLRFGFDLAPLFHHAARIAELAQQAMEDLAQNKALRAEIRQKLQIRIEDHPDDTNAQNALKQLRRKLSITELERLLTEVTVLNEQCDLAKLSANDGQNVRHQQTLNTENKKTITVRDLKSACPTAHVFCSDAIETEGHVLTTARTFAPLLGIKPNLLRKAEDNVGIEKVALTLWLILEIGNSIRRPAAYFRAVMLGRHARSFDPVVKLWHILDAQNPALSADNVTALTGREPG